MAVRIVGVSPEHPREDRLRPAVDILQAGGVVAMPTETFYGLGADGTDPEALVRVNRIKGKPDDAPVLLLAADVEQARAMAGTLPDGFDTLTSTFWPGPLTLVVPSSSELPPAVTAGRGTIGIRVPGLALPRRLAAMLGRPITGISANPTGRPAIRTAAAVLDAFGDAVPMVLDGGATSGGAPSTVVDLSGDRPRVLRHGTLPIKALRPFLPGLVEESRATR